MLSGGSPPGVCVHVCGTMLSGGSPPGVCVQVWQDVKWRLSTRCVCACVARC